MLPLPKFITSLSLDLGLEEGPKLTITYYPTDEEAEALFKLLNKQHDWVSDGVSIHNGEYWYRCTKCGTKDWIASYGTLDQLRPIECTNY